MLVALLGYSQANPSVKQSSASKLHKTKVELACGECQFNMEGKGCDLAIRYKGISYFVDGRHIDDFGDAHDKKTGLCNTITKAKVTGEIINGRFKARNIVFK